MKRKWTQQIDDEWFPVTWPHAIACCDCGLVHELRIKKHSKTGRWIMSARRLPNATGGKRAALKRAKKGLWRGGNVAP